MSIRSLLLFALPGALLSLPACTGDPGDSGKDDVPVDADEDGVNAGDDCDDDDPAVSPLDSEVCDGKDNNCDGVIDEPGTADGLVFHADVDGDTYGSATATVVACAAPEGTVTDATDCDDGTAAVHPGAAEVCNDIDDNCVDGADELGAELAPTWYADTDGDEYGDANATTDACVAPFGYVGDQTDCADGDAAISPVGAEVCNGTDDDCDGVTDEPDAADADYWYADDDDDGFGDVNAPTRACDQPPGYEDNYLDCDDEIAAANPAADETCNFMDDDCDGSIDESDAVDRPAWYLDADSDGYGSTASLASCDQPRGYVDNDDDCDDRSASVSPGGTEVCNFTDDDCDAAIDETFNYYYPDADGDGYGSSAATASCTGGSGYMTSATDCDDGSDDVYPGASELCDGALNDCDDTAWTTSSEDGVVSWLDGAGAWTDMSADFGAGSSGAPAYVTLPEEGTVYVCDGTYYVSAYADEDSSLELVGLNGPGGAILDGGDTARLFETYSATLGVTGLTLQNGYGDSGGAIYAIQTALTIDDCVLSENGANDYGGAIFATSSSSVTVSGSELSGNYAAAGGAAWMRESTLSLTSSSLSGNTADYGGALWSYAGTTSLILSTLEGNYAYYYGGGAYLASSSLNCTGSASSRAGFLANYADYGGGLYLDDSSRLSASDCDFGAAGSADDNEGWWWGDGDDVLASYYFDIYSYGDDETFDCDGYSCY